MRLASVETVLPAGIPATLPFRTLQTTSQSSSVLKLILLLPAALALLFPFLLIAERLATSDTFRAALNARPGAVVQLTLGLAFWTLLFGWPMKRIAESFARMRTVKIDAGALEVSDTGLFKHHTWHEPVAAFSGIAHHIRTSLSGVRHELVLVHPDRDKSVLLAIAPRLTQPDVDQMCALLSCREVPSRELYKIRMPAMTWMRKPEPVAAA
jgi:hypothetical protein